jgi:hypothetical protein
MKPITITNNKILKYFHDHPEIDEETSFLLFIDILEKFGDKLFEKMSVSINQQILTSLNENSKQLTVINENILKINSETMNSLYIKMLEIKKEYINDMKSVLLSNSVTATDKITANIEKNNNSLLDKTTILINELVPKNNDVLFKNISEKINSIILALKEETEKIQKIASNGNIETVINSYYSNIEKQNRELIDKITQVTNEIPKSNDIHFNRINQRINDINIYFKEETEKIQKTVSNNDIETNLKVSFSAFEKNNQNLIDKTVTLLLEIIPKSNETIYNTINNIQNSIKSETDKIYGLFSKEEETINKKFNEIEKEFVNMFSNMQSNFQTPIHNFINTSEEHINKNISNIAELTNKNISVQTQLYSEMNDFLNKYRNSTVKGAVHETQLENLLCEMHTSAEVLNTTGLTDSGDFILKRKDKPTILVENKQYKSNVPALEVKKFEDNCNTKGLHGIFLSQTSGIANRENYQINYQNGLILIYLHHVDYSKEKIRAAIEMIDGLSVKLNQIREQQENNNNDNIISKETLEEINIEYRKFSLNKDKMISHIKETYKTSLSNMDDIKMPSLDKYLSQIFVLENTINLMNEFHCHCGKSYQTPRGLSMHQHACKNKNSITTTA